MDRGQGGRVCGREPVGLAEGGGRERRQRRKHKREKRRVGERNGEAGEETEGEGRHECPAGWWEGRTEGTGGGRKVGGEFGSQSEAAKRSRYEEKKNKKHLLVSRNLESYVFTGAEFTQTSRHPGRQHQPAQTDP